MVQYIHSPEQIGRLKDINLLETVKLQYSKI